MRGLLKQRHGAGFRGWAQRLVKGEAGLGHLNPVALLLGIVERPVMIFAQVSARIGNRLINRTVFGNRKAPAVGGRNSQALAYIFIKLLTRARVLDIFFAIHLLTLIQHNAAQARHAQAMFKQGHLLGVFFGIGGFECGIGPFEQGLYLIDRPVFFFPRMAMKKADEGAQLPHFKLRNVERHGVMQPVFHQRGAGIALVVNLFHQARGPQGEVAIIQDQLMAVFQLAADQGLLIHRADAPLLRQGEVSLVSWAELFRRDCREPVKTRRWSQCQISRFLCVEFLGRYFSQPLQPVIPELA